MAIKSLEPGKIQLATETAPHQLQERLKMSRSFKFTLADLMAVAHQPIVSLAVCVRPLAYAKYLTLQNSSFCKCLFYVLYSFFIFAVASLAALLVRRSCTVGMESDTTELALLELSSLDNLSRRLAVEVFLHLLKCCLILSWSQRLKFRE